MLLSTHPLLANGTLARRNGTALILVSVRMLLAAPNIAQYSTILEQRGVSGRFVNLWSRATGFSGRQGSRIRRSVASRNGRVAKDSLECSKKIKDCSVEAKVGRSQGAEISRLKVSDFKSCVWVFALAMVTRTNNPNALQECKYIQDRKPFNHRKFLVSGCESRVRYMLSRLLEAIK